MWELLASDFEPGLATTLVARAYELLDERRYRHALLEAVSAVEVAVRERLRSQVGEDKLLLSAVQSFWELPLPARLITVCLGVTTETDLQKAIKAIARRNAIVHEGRESTKADGTAAKNLLGLARKLISGPTLKFPSVPHGNHLD